MQVPGNAYKTPIPYGRHFISEDDIAAVTAALLSNNLTQGPRIAEFEKDFAAYIGCRYAVAVSSGTAALHLCALALGVNEQSNVITSPITFAATANCIRYCNGNVWFADIDPATATLDIDKTEALILSKPKGFFSGIIPVDVAGYPVNMEAFRGLADKHGLWLIEDACHAPGGFFTDSSGEKQNCGNGCFAELAIFSFHPVKHIACGEGGMITTNDEQLYKKIMQLRTHGITKDADLMHENHGEWYYEMQSLGYNYRLTDIQSALGISQLKRADEGLARRKEIADFYFNRLSSDTGVSKPVLVEGHAFHLYVIRTQKRKQLYDFLRECSIICQVHYIPVHIHPYYKELGWKKGDFPMAEEYYDQCLSLPIYPTLTQEELNFVLEKIQSFLLQ
jgi:UDP-4-amino-4,6-dideoxy-N-acetyl-beta-L-altrosamine transaminase